MAQTFGSISDAIAFVEGLGVGDVRLDDAQKLFADGLRGISEKDYEKKGQYYYYLLRILLAKRMDVENPMSKNFYQRMTENFLMQDRFNQESLLKSESMRQRSMVKSQMKLFLKLMEKYYSTIESLYSRKEFLESRDDAYRQKMRFRKSRYLLDQQWSRYLSCALLEVFSDFGLSVLRIFELSALTVILFGFFFYLTDIISPEQIIVGQKHFSFDYIYFSLMNITTSSTGAMMAHTFMQKLLAGIEVVLGLSFLGVLGHALLKRAQ